MRKHYKARREAIAGATIKIITDQGERALPPRTVRRGIAEIEQERLSPKSKSGVTA